MIFRKMHIFPDCRCADGYTLHAENSHMPYCSPPTASHSHLTRFRGISVPGGQREGTPDTLLRENRSRWATGKGHLERFCGDSVPGGRQEVTPGTLSQENRARWTAERDTWNAFAEKPCQVEGGERHLERFCRDSVPGGRQKRTPDTLSRE